MKRSMVCRIAVGAAVAVSLLPGTALAVGGYSVDSMADGIAGADDAVAARASSSSRMNDEFARCLADISAAANEQQAASEAAASQVEAAVGAVLKAATDHVLSYDPADIAAIGTQESTGHSICCPSFSCAYADAVIDGTVHDHAYYTCSRCSWTDWGGGNSSFRAVGSGSDEEVLREAYDQIAAGRPTVTHVSAGYGEHWVALIGYVGAEDPDHLTLDNFIALDPWDGAEIVASSRFRLYGDGCEHVSDR